MNIIIMLTILLGVMGVIGIVVVANKLINNVKETSVDILPYEDVMAIIHRNIEVQFEFKYKLEYKLKDIRILHDFEKELRDITKNVILSFSADFYKSVEHYHSRDYIYKYVTKNVEIMLIDFSDKIKVSTK